RGSSPPAAPPARRRVPPRSRSPRRARRRSKPPPPRAPHAAARARPRQAHGLPQAPRRARASRPPRPDRSPRRPPWAAAGRHATPRSPGTNTPRPSSSNDLVVLVLDSGVAARDEDLARFLEPPHDPDDLRLRLLDNLAPLRGHHLDLLGEHLGGARRHVGHQ